MKWGPIVAMLVLIALAVLLVAGEGSDLDRRDGAHAVELRLGNRLKGALTWSPGSDTFHVVLPDHRSAALDRTELARALGPDAVERLFVQPPNWLFRVFNVTGWASFVWVAVGILGQLAFFLRMAVQWVVSEKRGESVVPQAFWWLSLCGGAALYVYFVWRQDVIAALGQSTGVVIYARNLRLIHKSRIAESR